MLSAIKKNSSLTFYQPTGFSQKNTIPPIHTGGMASVAIANSSMMTMSITTGYNSQLGGFLNALNAERDRLSQKVAEGLATNPNYTGARSDGVSLAWDYEAADIRMGGKGSANWNKNQQNEILQNRPNTVNNAKYVDGKPQYPKAGVRGAEGHHQKNVADHPDQQANPDNIKFYEDRDAHLQEGHDGKWDNETDAPLINKNKMLQKTNTNRVFKNELRGLGIAVAIGAGVGITIGFAVTLAQSGVTPESIKFALAEGIKGGAEAGIMSAVSYGIGRTIGQMATEAVTGLLRNLGLTITDNISKMCGMGVIVTMTVVLFSVYQFFKFKWYGIATRDALIKIGKQSLFSLSLLAVSIAAQGIWGGPAGIIVSISIGIIVISYTLADTVHQRHFAEKIRIYMIDKCRPIFVE